MKRTFIHCCVLLLVFFFSLKGRPDNIWDVVFSFSAKAPFESGIATDGHSIYTTVGVKYPCPPGTRFFHQYQLIDDNWACIDSFNIAGHNGKPIITQELTWDGNYFYCLDEEGDSILRLDLNNRVLVSSIALTGLSPMNKVAYFDGGDNGNGAFFLTDGENLFLVSRAGVLLQDLTNHLNSPMGQLKWINGLTVDDFSENGPYLWIFDGTFNIGSPPLTGPMLWQYSIINDTLTGLNQIVDDIPGMDTTTWYGPAGLSLDAGNLVPGKLSLTGVLNPFVGSIVFGYQINDSSLQTIVHGIVTDDPSGNPIPYHTIMITADPSSGNLYQRELMTGLLGEYTDTIYSLYNTKMWIRTMDCQNNLSEADFYTSWHYVGQNFSICDSTHGQLPKAGFEYYLDSIGTTPRIFHFVNTSMGNPDWYLWHFGDGRVSTEKNPVHQYNTQGSYEVCLIVGTGNRPGYYSDTLCQTVVCPSYSLIGGLLFAGNAPINNPESTGDTGMVMLYRQQGHTLTAVDTSCFTYFGYYYFLNRIPGKYLIKACLTKNSTHYTEYFPTYYTAMTEWKNAQEIQLGDSSLFESNIFMIETPGLHSSGQGTISGSLVFPDSGGIMPCHQEVLLADINGHPLTFTLTNEDGSFIFNNLPFGDYHVFAEITGWEHEVAAVSLNASHQDTTNLLLHIFTNPVGMQEIKEKDDLLLYPNPATDHLNIRSSHGSSMYPGMVNLEIMDLSGRVLIRKSLNGRVTFISIPLNGLAPGSYLLNIEMPMKEESVIISFIKLMD